MFRIGSRSCLVLNVEKQMITHLAIVDVAVVGSPHEDDGKRPLAFFVLSEDSNVTAEELRSYTNGKFKAISWVGNWFDAFVNYLGKVMEEEKLRGGIRFIEKIPRNDLGKIIRPGLMKISC